MRDVQVGDTAMLECERCHAVWIDAATFEHICASRESQGAVLHQWPGQPTARTGEVRYRKCVACGTIMNRLNFGRLSGTIVDVCRGHGTFLDAGELHNIVAFIQAGGLDRARQRQIEDLKEEQQRLEAKLARPHEHSLGGDVKVSWNLGDVRILLDHLSKK